MFRERKSSHKNALLSIHQNIYSNDIISTDNVTSLVETVEKVEIMQEWYNDMLEIARENATKLYEEKDKVENELEDYKNKGLESKLIENANRKIDQLENTCVQQKSEISALKSQVKEPRSRNGDKTLKEKIEKLTANNKKLTETIAEMKIKLTSHADKKSSEIPDDSSSAKMNELNNELAKCKEELMAVSLKNVNLQRETLNTDQTLKNKIQGFEEEVEIRDKKIRSLKSELRRKQDLESTVIDSNKSEASNDSESRRANVNIGSGGGSGIVQNCLIGAQKHHSIPCCYILTAHSIFPGHSCHVFTADWCLI
ncbi:hypothetical protein GQR58_023004 [Nymphon striatum]|nr:hypothetical protein GQR58_023004 [Nymphon striatum]